MKRFILLVFVISLVSCSKSKEEQMLYDYINKGMIKTLNVDLKDTDFKIIEIEKIKEIKYSDSLTFIKLELAKLYSPKNYSKVKDTLTFNYVVNLLDNVLNSNKEIINKYLNAGMPNEAKDMLNKNKNYQEFYIKAKSLKLKYDAFKIQNDKILSAQYKGTYSMTNPLMKIKQTFTKFYYSNAENTIILKEEEIK